MKTLLSSHAHTSLQHLLVAAATAALVVSSGGSNPVRPPAAHGAEVRSPVSAATSHTVHKTSRVRYLVNPRGVRQELSVYSPTGTGGHWPTAVMIHGAGFPVDRWARNVARRGVVVFVPSWMNSPLEFRSAKQFRATTTTITRRMACAVRFARSRSKRYGGDPTYLSLFGFSAGANYAAQVALAHPRPTAGCLARGRSVTPDNLVVLDGDWLLLGAPFWTPFLRRDPGILDLFAPWSHLDTAPRIPVHILDSGDPSMNTRDNGYGAPKTWLPLRDPTGDLRRDLRRRQAFADGTVTETEMQRVLFDELRRHHFHATFHTFGGIGHIEALDSPAHLQRAVDAMLADR